MYALFVVDLTEKLDSELPPLEYKFLEKAESIQNIHGPATKLSRNCWLLSLQTQLTVLYNLMRQATESNLTYKVFFFEKEPIWCKSKY